MEPPPRNAQPRRTVRARRPPARSRTITLPGARLFPEGVAVARDGSLYVEVPLGLDG